MKNILMVFLFLPLYTVAQVITTTAGNSMPGYSGDGTRDNKSPTNAHTKKMQKNRQRILALLQKQEQQRQARMNAAERTTSVTAERVIAFSDYDYYGPDSVLYALGEVDTSVCMYSHGRGSEFNYNAMEYETPSNVWEDGYLIPYLATGWRITSSEPNYVPGVLCDTTRSWSSNILTSGIPLYTFGFSDSSYVIYDVNNNIVYYNDQPDPDSMDVTGDIYFNTYDISNNNITSLYIQYVPSTPAFDTDDVTIQIFSGGVLVEDSLAAYGGGGVFYPSDRWIYSYDGSGNLVLASEYNNSSGPWVEDTRYTMTYNADNTIKTDSETEFESGLWVPWTADSFGYTSGVNYYTYMRFDDYGGSYMIDQSFITTKHVGSLGFPDTVFSWQYVNRSGGTPLYLNSQYKSVYTYDSYINPKIVYNYHFNITDSTTGAGYYNATPDGYTYYYYETYMSSAAVQNIAATTENIKIYPNPATTTLNILSTNQPINEVVITNLLGQTLFTSNYNSEQAAVDVANLPAGLYLVRVNGTEVRKFVKE